MRECLRAAVGSARTRVCPPASFPAGFARAMLKLAAPFHRRLSSQEGRIRRGVTQISSQEGLLSPLSLTARRGSKDRRGAFGRRSRSGQPARSEHPD